MTLVATTVTLVVFATARDLGSHGRSHRRRHAARTAHVADTYEATALFTLTACRKLGEVLASAEFDSLEHAQRTSPWRVCEHCLTTLNAA